MTAGPAGGRSASIPQLDAPPALRDPATLSLGVRPAAAPGSFPDDRWWTALGEGFYDFLFDALALIA